MALTAADKEKVKRVIPKASNKVIDASIARLYIAYPDPKEWVYTGLSGAIVLVDDIVGHTFFLKLVDVQGHRGVIWDQELYLDFQYNQDRSFFHTFEIEDCLVGLLFDDTTDASHFYKKVTTKEKHGSKKTIQNKNAVALKKKPENERIVGPRGEFHSTDQSKIRTIHNVLYYDDLPPPEWRSLYTELANAGITEDMIADNKDFIKDYINKQGGPLVGLEPPIPRKYKQTNVSTTNSGTAATTTTTTTSTIRKKAPPPPPPSSSSADVSASPISNSPSPSPLPSEPPVPSAQPLKQTVHRVPPPLATSQVHSVPPPFNQTQHTNSVPPPLPPSGSRPTPPLPSGSRPAPPLPSSNRPSPIAPPPRANIPPPPQRAPFGQQPQYGQQIQYGQSSTYNSPSPSPSVQSRAPPPAPPPRRGGAPPPAPPPRASNTNRVVPPPPQSRIQTQPTGYQPYQQNVQQPVQQPSYNTSAPVAPPLPPQAASQTPTSIAPPLPQQTPIPQPLPSLPFSTPQVGVATSYVPQGSSSAPPPPPPPLPSQVGSAAPPPPPLPPTQGGAAPPAPPPLPAQSSAPLVEATGDVSRDALLASIRGSGLGNLKKVDKSQLDKPSVILQEQRTEPGGSIPSANTGASAAPGAQGSLADALAAALSSRKQKVSRSDDESDGEEW